MKQVLVNVEFRDRYTGEKYIPGKTYPMSEERVKEVKEVNPNFITVVGNAAATVPVEEAQIEEVPVEELTEDEMPEEKNSEDKKSEDDSEDEAPEEEKVEEPPVEKPKKGKKVK